MKPFEEDPGTNGQDLKRIEDLVDQFSEEAMAKQTQIAKEISRMRDELNPYTPEYFQIVEDAKEELRLEEKATVEVESREDYEKWLKQEEEEWRRLNYGVPTGITNDSVDELLRTWDSGEGR